MSLSGSVLQKGDKYAFTIDLVFTLKVTLVSGSTQAKVSNPGYADILERSAGWTISGTGLSANTTIKDFCSNTLEIELSQSAIASGLQTLTVTTGSLNVYTSIELTVYLDVLGEPVITKTLTTTSTTTAEFTIERLDTNSLPFTKKALTLELTYFIKGINSSNGLVDTLSSGEFTVAVANPTPSLPTC